MNISPNLVRFIVMSLAYDSGTKVLVCGRVSASSPAANAIFKGLKRMCSKRILIIDDEAPMRYLLERQLCRAGYMVSEAKDGFAGLSAVANEVPDLVVLDLMMPGIDGFEVFRRLRGNYATAAIPVVFLSGSVNNSTRRRAFAMGAADILAKPHQITDLASVVEGVFRRQEAHNEETSRGRVVSLFSLTPGQSSTTMAVNLSRTVALHTTWPVLLIDLDLEFSPVASRLSLRRTPHILHLLEHAAVPMTTEEVAPYIQPQHVGMGVITAPIAPADGDVASLPRLRAALDELRASGYYVVIHLGNELTDLALSAMRGSDLVCALTATPDTSDAYEAFVRSAAARGVDPTRITPIGGDLVEVGGATQIGASITMPPNRVVPDSPIRVGPTGAHRPALSALL